MKRAAVARVKRNKPVAEAVAELQPAALGPVPDPLRDIKTSAADQNAAPPVLLAYQQRWIADQADLKVGEKGRRIGLTWAEAADDVLIAAAQGGSNVFYISATHDMAREYIEACAMWARAYDRAASEIQDGLFDDGPDVAPEKRYIKTFEIVFPATGRRIVALSSRPENMRGKQGVIVIDEAAFQGALGALLKAAMAMIMWGDKVRILSTHYGATNPFNELIQEVRAGKRGGPTEATVHKITFRDAVADGLYSRVCMRRGIPWTQAGEDEWVTKVYAFYGTDAAEELDVIPSQSGGIYLPLALIESRMTQATPLIRGHWDDKFLLIAEDTRKAEVLDWCKRELNPVIESLNALRWHFVGEDFGRHSDLTVLTVLEEESDLTERVKLVVELANCPFQQQEEILFYLLDRVPRLRSGAMDAGGNGAALAEAAAIKYGTQRIEQVKLSETFYLVNMPKFKSALVDGTLTGIPMDDQLRDDLRALRVIDGVAKLPKGNTSKAALAAGDSQRLKRHGDFAISLFLANYAVTRETGLIEFQSAPAKASGDGDDADDDDFTPRAKSAW